MSHPGEIVLIPFPYTNLSTTKRRPVLVLRPADTFGDFLAVAVTSQTGHQDAVPLIQADFQEGILPKPSYVRTSKLYTLNERIIIHRFGALTPEPLRAHIPRSVPRLTASADNCQQSCRNVQTRASIPGGLSPYASENNIKILRRINGEQKTFRFKYSRVEKGEDLEQNIILQGGDIVVVP